MVVFFIILCFGCYVMGRNKGQQEGRAMAAQELGINLQSPTMVAVADGVMTTGTSPPAPLHQYPAFPSPSPHQPNPNLKLQNGTNKLIFNKHINVFHVI
ncbi:hypothetical protein CRYUN_Cryun32bG0070300 [Craigia yunnanensis]